MSDILDSIGPRALTTFKKDFAEMMRIAFGIDRSYGETSEDYNFYFPKYEKLVKSFNKKYKNLHLSIRRSEEEIKLRIFIKEKDVKKIFNEVASKLAGLKSIGASSFGKASTQESDKYAKELTRVSDRIFLSYYEAESGSNTIYLEYDKKQKMVEMHYDFKGIRECKTPEYRLIAFYAAKDLDNKVDIQTPASKFGFSSSLTPDELKEWTDDFNPNFTE